ncbi:MAG: HIT domain-containing protein [Acidimicrobiia bacterium]|nr:HIT domain-containing protein [Acidimicrobiia bacterium]
MAHIDQLWAGWRSEYVQRSAQASIQRRLGQDVAECILCEIAKEGKDHYVIAKTKECFVVMNLYPYSNGHLMVVPLEHHQNLENFSDHTRNEVMRLTNTASKILREVYNPDGINIGANLGEAAGAGIPGHMHMHVLPRWMADSGFITTVANTRALPETLESSYERIWNLWPENERVSE